MNTATDENQVLNDYIDSLGLEYTAEFVPASRRPERDQGVNWDVTLAKPGHRFTVSYWQGLGHIPGYKHMYGRRTIADKEEQDARAYEATENGRIFHKMASWGSPFGFKPLPSPDIKDVLFSLVMDAEAIDHPNYEDWADMLGCDRDSREGEKIYKQCLEHGLHLRKMIGEQALRDLRDLFADY